MQPNKTLPPFFYLEDIPITSPSSFPLDADLTAR